MINQERIYYRNKKEIDKKGKYVLYWAQTTLRVRENFALSLSIKKANELKKPLLVIFGVVDHCSWANRRQYHFLYQGLINFKNSLEENGINFLVRKIKDKKDYLPFIDQASVFICDFGYQRNQRYWRSYLADQSPVLMVEVEGDVIFPVKFLANKEINYAFQIRKRIFENLPYFLETPVIPEVKNKSKICNQSEEEIKKIFSSLEINEEVKPVKFFGGEKEALKYLNYFINHRLPYYQKFRSHPDKNFQSDLSPYLHFGFISPLTVIKEILKFYSLRDPNVIAFINELVLWRELARNFVYFNEHYDSWQCLPDWAVATLDQHQHDKREYIYSLEDLEKARTHDCYWNAAQKEMVITGKMHNYMRMYWAKKVIGWTKDWRKAYQWLIYLNDKYELDGRDPNGYAGIAWSFGKFDRPWMEREIFGQVRYMNDRGLERKFNMKLYVEKIKTLELIGKK